MREMKYRVWDTVEKRMLIGGADDCITVDMEGLIYYLGEFRPEYQERFVILLWTGLKDNKGWQIFEGDIVNVESTQLNTTQEVVKWVDSGFNLKKEDMQYIPMSMGGELRGYENIYTYEIIGNIYEKPKLMKEIK